MLGCLGNVCFAENLIDKPRREKTCLCEQHPRSLISAFVVRCLDSIISIFVISKISRLQLVTVAEQAGLSQYLVGNPEDRFSCDVAQLQNSFSHDESHPHMFSNRVIYFEPRYDKTTKMACVPSEASDQPIHPPSLIRVVAVRMKKA